MVTIEKNKLTIEIETQHPIAMLVDYQNAIIDTLQHYTEDCESRTTSDTLGELLSNLILTSEQNEAFFIG